MMLRSAAGHLKRIVVTSAVCRLVVRARDGNTTQMAVQKCAHRTMGDYGNRASCVICCHDALHSGNNASLRVRRSLPPFDRLVWMGEERVGHAFKFRRWKKASGRSVVFAELAHNRVGQPEMTSENFRGILRLAFCTGIHRAQFRDPRLAKACTHALLATLGQRPLGNGQTRIDDHVRVCDEERASHFCHHLSIEMLEAIGFALRKLFAGVHRRRRRLRFSFGDKPDGLLTGHAPSAGA